jgi:hypothetical protein
VTAGLAASQIEAAAALAAELAAEPTIRRTMSQEDYRALPAVAHSDLQEWAKGKRTAAGRRFALGTALHLILADHKLAAQTYATAPEDWDLRTRAGKEAMAAHEEETGKIGIRPRERAQLEGMMNALYDHDQAADMIRAEGDVEIAVLARLHTGVASKGLLDKVTPGPIVDYKSTGLNGPEEFRKATTRYGYDSQAAYYVDLYEMATGERRPFLWVCVNKTTCEVWTMALSSEQYRAGRRWYGDMLSLWERFHPTEKDDTP